MDATFIALASLLLCKLPFSAAINNYCQVNPNPCLNGGVCVDRLQNPSIVSWYICSCPASFSGDHCEFGRGSGGSRNNYCAVNRNPCLNGGRCVDRTENPSIVSWYICQCPAYFTGDHCEIVGSGGGSRNNYCAVNRNPCLNGGRCVDRAENPSIVSWYICQCPTSFTGDHCEIGSGGSRNNYCSVNRNPCLNGGVCVDRSHDPTILSWYICRCPSSYTGDSCEIFRGSRNNYCSVNRNPCLNGGICVDRSRNPSIVSRYVCSCPPFYTGDYCEIGTDTGRNTYCQVNRNPCLNGGICIDRSQNPSILGLFVCRCPAIYTGEYCELRVWSDPGVQRDYCSVNPNPCMNGGICTDRSHNPSIISWYICNCPALFTGDHCEIAGSRFGGDYCKVNPNPCLNGGVCVDRSQDPSILSWYICNCPASFSGDSCEFGVGGGGARNDYCRANRNPCLNGGVCVDRSQNPSIISWYICSCPTTYSGDHCEFFRGTVPDHSYAGVGNNYCTRNRNPCLNGGVCVDGSQDPSIGYLYRCSCLPSYTGDHCENAATVILSPPTAYGHCSSYPGLCLNGGYCVDKSIDPYLLTLYRCQCPLGCAGDHCENCPGLPRTEETCDDDPCLNGGSCFMMGTDVLCYCPHGCSGYHCENCSAPVPCSSNPCKGDCVCQPSCSHAEGYFCESKSGLLGKNCDIPAPTLECKTNEIVISISEEFVEEYDRGLENSFILISPDSRVNPNSCTVKTAVNGLYKFTIPLPFDGCGTEISTEANGEMTFTNVLWLNRALSNPDFDMPVPAARIQCKYTREYKIVTSIKPVVEKIKAITDIFRIIPDVSLCKAPACPSACPKHLEVNGGAVYTIGESMHVTLSLDTYDTELGQNIVNTLHTMTLSCSENPDDGLDVVELLRNGCGSQSGIPFDVSHTGKSSTVCVSFATPRLPCEEFYIHAELRACASTDLQDCEGPSNSNHYCTSDAYGAGRVRRSIGENKVIILGPIYILTNASQGISMVDMFPEEKSFIPPVQTLNEFIEVKKNSNVSQELGPKLEKKTSDMGLNILIGAVAFLFVLFLFLATLAYKVRNEYVEQLEE